MPYKTFALGFFSVDFVMVVKILEELSNFIHTIITIFW